MNKVSNKINYKSIALAFEFSKAGVCTLQVHNQNTGFKAGGGSYDKIGAVFAEFFNHHFNTEKLLKRKGVKDICGHIYGKLFGCMDSHANILESLRGFNIEYITETKTAIVYKFEYNQAFLDLNKGHELLF